jgi:hypothetical protein
MTDKIQVDIADLLFLIEKAARWTQGHLVADPDSHDETQRIAERYLEDPKVQEVIDFSIRLKNALQS